MADLPDVMDSDQEEDEKMEVLEEPEYLFADEMAAEKRRYDAQFSTHEVIRDPEPSRLAHVVPQVFEQPVDIKSQPKKQKTPQPKPEIEPKFEAPTTQVPIDGDYITLKAEGDEIPINRSYALLSDFVRTTLNKTDVDNPTITIPNLKFNILEHVAIYLFYRKGTVPTEPIEYPLRSVYISHAIKDEWERDWIDAFDPETLLDLIWAAHYLVIDSLLQLACAKMAVFIRTLPYRDIHRILSKPKPKFQLADVLPDT